MKNFLAALTVLSALTTTFAGVVHVDGDGRYRLTFWQAYQKCFERGASLATVADLHEMRKSGRDHCSCGWLADRTARYPMNSTEGGCGGRPGVHVCYWRDHWNAYCFQGKYERCNKPLGMELGSIPNNRLSAPSAHHNFFNDRWEPRLARLNQKGVINAWMPHHDDPEQYLQINLGEARAVTGIMTQGVRRYFRNQYVKQFKIRYSKDASLWIYQYEGNSIKIYEGNTDNDSVVRNMFSEPFLAQYVRIYPVLWSQHISLRVELLGCTVEEFDEIENRKVETGVFLLNGS